MGRTAAGAKEFGGFFSSAKGFELLPGSQVDGERPRGYYIDFRLKAQEHWPPPWLDAPKGGMHVNVAQWGLGAFERWLAGDGDRWLDDATACGEHMLAAQGDDGAWRHREPYHHTFPLAAGWISAMAQGQGASLFVRLHVETGEERWAQAAAAALPSMPFAELGGGRWPEEYPTQPASFVLNGGVFAIWGLYDVARTGGSDGAEPLYRECADVLAANVGRWDLGWWSRYDLFPHPVPNVAASSYHLLHQSQLAAQHRLDPRPELEAARDRFAAYERSPLNRRRAFAQKALFRILVPRRKDVARRLPWSPYFRRRDL